MITYQIAVAGPQLKALRTGLFSCGRHRCQHSTATSARLLTVEDVGQVEQMADADLAAEIVEHPAFVLTPEDVNLGVK